MLEVRFIESWKAGQSPKNNIETKNSMVILDDSSYYAYQVNNKDEIVELAREFVEASSEQSSKFPYSIVEIGTASYLPDNYNEDESDAVVLQCLHPEEHEDYYFENEDEIEFDYEKFSNAHKIIYSQTSIPKS